ncbi:hypothetical protein BDV25DRAFT_146854 [Aspergillus avenaceus]|uniref:Uncharacterized protein n=1 Tax=Aspergillus avenaceus TaxID=36643 RepID=A0A5N6U8S2_ASPAV|nr:hypothetical protein BDV25DRAFT_146854 [Aspergillus avenaceus]
MALAYPNELPAPDSPERTQACCYKVDKDRCADGTAGTPFCGYGPCNIFGCACEGGCRRRK